MTKVIYNSENKQTTFSDLVEGDYFDYNGKLFLFIEDFREGLVFDLEEGYSFCWCDEFTTDVPITIIAPSRVTIQID